MSVLCSPAMASPPPDLRRKRHGVVALIFVCLFSAAVLILGFPKNPVALVIGVAFFITWLALLIGGTVLRSLGRL